MSRTIALGARDFLTADLHIGGAPWPYKLWFSQKKGDPVENVRRMVQNGWDSAVREDTQVVIVGDAIDQRADVEAALQWWSERPGHKILIPGNHDAVHEMNDHGFSELREQGWFDVFEVVDSRRTTLKFEGFGEVLACHYPHSESRQLAYRHAQAAEATPVIHGHTHSRKGSTRTAEGVLQLNVGWPARRKLVSALEIADELERWAVQGP